jgi:AcrR family transcriptional regulator
MIEHLGCSKWNDTTEAGYHGTGRAELFAVWATQGTMANLVQETIAAHDLPRTAVLRPPAQFGVGGPFQTAGIPQIGAIAGPEYLLTVSPSGEMEKLDAALAARQIAWLADLATRLDPVPAAQLRQGDPTLGGPSSTGNIVPSSAVPKNVACGPSPATTSDYMIRIGNLVVDYDGFKPSLGGVLLGAWTTSGAVHHLEIELLHGARRVSRVHVPPVTTRHRRVVLRGHHGHRLAPGRYRLVIKLAGRGRARHRVDVTWATAMERVTPGVFFAELAVLPRGRHTLTRDQVRAIQRERLMVAITELMAERGYRNVTIQDIVGRAGVSRSAFYDCFTRKEDCAFAAYDRFIEVLLTAIAQRTADSADWESFIVGLLDGYVSTLVRDLVVARAFQIEMDAVGPEARKRRRRALRRFAAFIRSQQERLAADDPTLQTLPDEPYLGAVYAARQVACDALDQRRTADLLALVPRLSGWMAAGFRDAGASPAMPQPARRRT